MNKNAKMIRFRNLLAEQGMEMTVEQAKETYKLARYIVKSARKMSTVQFWTMLETEVEGISEEDKKQLVSLYQCAKEL